MRLECLQCVNVFKLDEIAYEQSLRPAIWNRCDRLRRALWSSRQANLLNFKELETRLLYCFGLAGLRANMVVLTCSCHVSTTGDTTKSHARINDTTKPPSWRTLLDCYHDIYYKFLASWKTWIQLHIHKPTKSITRLKSTPSINIHKQQGVARRGWILNTITAMLCYCSNNHSSKFTISAVWVVMNMRPPRPSKLIPKELLASANDMFGVWYWCLSIYTSTKDRRWFAYFYRLKLQN